MDDLLRAFQADVSQDLAACDADLERLRKTPGDAASAANLHRLFCSIREMSVVLGQRKLADAASRGARALESGQAGDAVATARAIPTVAECLAQIRTLLGSIEYSDDGAVAGRAQPSPEPLAASADDHAALAHESGTVPATRSRSDAFDMIGDDDEAVLPALAAEHRLSAPISDATEARPATIEVGEPILGASRTAGRKRAR